MMTSSHDHFARPSTIVGFGMPLPLNAVSAQPIPKTVNARRLRKLTSCASISELDLREPPPRLIFRSALALRKLYTSDNAEIHRGRCAHRLSRRSAEALDEARHVVSTSMGVSNKDEIVFANDLPSAHFLLARAITASLSPGDEILLAVNIPDVCLRIWHSVATSRKLVPRLVTTALAKGAVPDIADFAQLVSGRTRVVIVPLVCPITLQRVLTPSLIPFLRAVARVTVVDASVYAWLLPFPNFPEIGIDFVIAHPGNTVTPSGAVIAGKHDAWNILPPVEGADPDISDSELDDDYGKLYSNQLTEPLDLYGSPNIWGPPPERFEPLSNSVATAVTTAAAMVDHVDTLSGDTVRCGKRLAQNLHEGLKECPGILVFTSISTTPEAPIACFTTVGVETNDVARSLGTHGVKVDIVSSGLSVALRRGAGVDSVLRVSFDPKLHSEDDVDKFISILQQVMEYLSTCQVSNC